MLSPRGTSLSHTVLQSPTHSMALIDWQPPSNKMHPYWNQYHGDANQIRVSYLKKIQRNLEVSGDAPT